MKQTSPTMGCIEESLSGTLCPSTLGGLKMLRARVCKVCIRSNSCINPEMKGTVADTIT